MLCLVERLRGGVLAAVAAHFGFNGADSLMPAPAAVAMLSKWLLLQSDWRDSHVEEYALITAWLHRGARFLNGNSMVSQSNSR